MFLRLPRFICVPFVIQLQSVKYNTTRACFLPQAREWYREDLVGEALSAFLSESNLNRSEVFLTSKIHPRHLGFNATARQLAVSLRELKTYYLDLLLLHYPECWGDLCGGIQPEGTWRDSWRALEGELYNISTNGAFVVDLHL